LGPDNTTPLLVRDRFPFAWISKVSMGVLRPQDRVISDPETDHRQLLGHGLKGPLGSTERWMLPLSEMRFHMNSHT
jgi:hypothetical protein